MIFKKFLENYHLFEAFNRGDVAEGIFAAAIATLIATGDVSSQDINDIRRQVNPKDNESEVVIDSNIADNPNILDMLGKMPDPGDKITVILRLLLKKASVSGVYGSKMKKTKADKLIQTIIDKVKHIRLISKIKAFIQEVLTNRKTDEVVFYVVADGAGNTDKNGVIKSDVNISIEAKTKTPVPQDIREPLRFSIKVGEPGAETTVLNSGLFQGILSIAKRFQLPMVKGMEGVELKSNKKINAGNWMDSFDPLTFQDVAEMSQQEGHFFHYMNAFMSFSQTPGREEETKQGQVLMYKAMVMELKEQLEVADDKKNFEKLSLDFLFDAIFGSDVPDVISISDEDIREINRVDFEDMRNKVDIDFTTDEKGSMVFRDRNTNKIIYRIRPKLRDEGHRPTVFLYVDVSDLLFR